MCPRQIHLVEPPAKWSTIATGCGSWTTTKSYASGSTSSALLALYCRKSSSCSGVSPRSSPCSALWIRFVTSKNSSCPRMTRHSTSRPASAMSGTSVYRISATPPPNAVADRWSTRFPASGSARRRISSMSPRVAIVA